MLFWEAKQNFHLNIHPGQVPLGLMGISGNYILTGPHHYP